MLIQVSLSLNIADRFTYACEGDETSIRPGKRVVVPVGNRITTGWVMETHSSYPGKVKKIIGIIEDTYLPDSNMMEFSRRISQLYFCSEGLVLDGSLSPKRKSLNHIWFEENGKSSRLSRTNIAELIKLSAKSPLNLFYKTTVNVETPQNTSWPATERTQRTFVADYDRLIHYGEPIRQCLQRRQSVILIVPDNLSAEYIRSHLDSVCVYNSGIPVGERERIWGDALSMKVRVFAGGLSACLLPMPGLGLVICDRVGSSLYKSRSFSDFNVNFMARIRAECHSIPFIEGDATYTLEAYRNRRNFIIEDHRPDQLVPVNVHAVKRGQKGIPAHVVELIKDRFLRERRVLVVLNRKHSSQYLFCSQCKKPIHCPVCHSSLKIDKSGQVSCVACSFTRQTMDNCTVCNQRIDIIEDISITALKEIVEKQVNQPVLAVTSDEIKTIDQIMEKIRKSRLIISTPVILHPFFKHLFDSIIYVQPESLFNFSTFDAAERIFAMVANIRETVNESGEIDIFSTFHFHYSLRLLNDEKSFFERELKYREWFSLPPFTQVYHISFRNKNLRILGREMRKNYQKFKKFLNIKEIYLVSRKKTYGYYRGVFHLHTSPEAIEKSGLSKDKNVNIQLEMV